MTDTHTKLQPPNQPKSTTEKIAEIPIPTISDAPSGSKSGEHNVTVLHAINQSLHDTRHSIWKDYDRSTIYSTSDLHHEENKEMSKCGKCLYNLRHSLPLIHPAGPLLKIWHFFVLMLLIYTCIEVPTTIAFRIELNIGQPFGTTAFLIDILLFIDILVAFRTAYFDKWDKLTLIISDKAIAKNYFYGWFFFDFITCIPFQIVNNIPGGEKYMLLFLSLRSIKLIRVLKMVRYVKHFEKSYITDRQVKIGFELFKLVCQALLFSHFAACVWWFVGDRTNPSWLDANDHFDKIQDIQYPVRQLTNDQNFLKYSYAYYWAVVTVFTTGYGDITPTNLEEQWVAIVLILCGTIFFSYFIGTLTALITEGDKVKLFKDERLEEAKFFCDQKKLPRELARAVITHTRYHCDYNYVFDETDLISSLPPQLQNEIQRHLGLNILHQIDFFKEIDASVLGEISLRMRSISCNEQMNLFNKDDRAKHIYIQRTGTSILKNPKSKRGNTVMKRGSICGEMALISAKRKTTVTCLTWSEFYVLSVNDIVFVLQSEYPSTWKRKFRSIVKCVRNTKSKMHSIRRRVDFDTNRYAHIDAGDFVSDFMNSASTIQTKRFGGVSSLRLGYDGQLSSGQEYEDDNNGNKDSPSDQPRQQQQLQEPQLNTKHMNSNSIFGTLRDKLVKKKQVEENKTTIALTALDPNSIRRASTDGVLNEIEIPKQTNDNSKKSVLPFFKHRRNSYDRDQAVSYAYQKRKQSLAGMLNMEDLDIVDEKVAIDVQEEHDPYGAPSDTESTSASEDDKGDVVPDFSFEPTVNPHAMNAHGGRNNSGGDARKRARKAKNKGKSHGGTKTNKNKRRHSEMTQMRKLAPTSPTKSKSRKEREADLAINALMGINVSSTIAEQKSDSQQEGTPPITPIMNATFLTDSGGSGGDGAGGGGGGNNSNKGNNNLRKESMDFASDPIKHAVSIPISGPIIEYKSKSKSKTKSKTKSKSKSGNGGGLLSNLGQKGSKSNVLNTIEDHNDDSDGIELPRWDSSHSHTTSTKRGYGKSHTASLRSNVSSSRLKFMNAKKRQSKLMLEAVVSGLEENDVEDVEENEEDMMSPSTYNNPTPQPTEIKTEDPNLDGFNVSQEYHNLTFEEDLDAPFIDSDQNMDVDENGMDTLKVNEEDKDIIAEDDEPSTRL